DPRRRTGDDHRATPHDARMGLPGDRTAGGADAPGPDRRGPRGAVRRSDRDERRPASERRPMTRRLIAAAVLTIVAVACRGSDTPTTSPATADVSDVHTFAASVEAPASNAGVAQVVADLHNAGDAKDELVSVSCSCGGTATLFEPNATKPTTSI